MHSADPARLPIHINLGCRVGIVHALFHEKEVSAMVARARAVLLQAKLPASHVSLHPAAGSFEIPLIGAALAKAKKVDALLGFGIIVEGETHHAELLAETVAQGIMTVQLDYTIPFAFEILYVDHLDLARARADKGAEAAYAVLHSLAELHRIQP